MGMNEESYLLASIHNLIRRCQQPLVKNNSILSGLTGGIVLFDDVASRSRSGDGSGANEMEGWKDEMLSGMNWKIQHLPLSSIDAGSIFETSILEILLNPESHVTLLIDRFCCFD